jgi:hypothetical protein
MKNLLIFTFALVEASVVLTEISGVCRFLPDQIFFNTMETLKAIA